MGGRREVVKAKILAENKVHVWKVHVCPLLIKISGGPGTGTRISLP